LARPVPARRRSRNQRAGEATPAYLFSEQAAARMGAVIPDAKLIALLRHPVDRAYSHYWLARTLGYESRSFPAAVDDELRGRTTPGLEYLAYGRYLEQLERMRAYFPQPALFVGLFEDLRAASASFYAECCRHVGVDDAIVPAIVGRRINRPLRQRSVGLFRVLERWRNSRRAGFGLARFVAARNSVPFEPPAMTGIERGALLEHFAPYNEALANSLGRDLSVWKR
jgi:hypothetical protein